MKQLSWFADTGQSVWSKGKALFCERELYILFYCQKRHILWQSLDWLKEMFMIYIDACYNAF